MNTIKTIIYATLFGVLTLACSKSDDNNVQKINPLIGTWYENEVIGEPVPLNDCEKKSNYAFTESQMTVKIYALNSENTCVLTNNGGTIAYTFEGDKIKVKYGTDDVEIRFVINNDVLSLFHPQSNGSFVEIKYIKK